jgi:hypothetical protein
MTKGAFARHAERFEELRGYLQTSCRESGSRPAARQVYPSRLVEWPSLADPACDFAF